MIQCVCGGGGGGGTAGLNRLYAVDANMRQEAVCVYKRRLSPPFHIERFLARTVSSVGMGHEAAGSNPAKSWPRSSSL